jgi:hypothetical protein
MVLAEASISLAASWSFFESGDVFLTIGIYRNLHCVSTPTTDPSPCLNRRKRPANTSP